MAILRGGEGNSRRRIHYPHGPSISQDFPGDPRLCSFALAYLGRSGVNSASLKVIYLWFMGRWRGKKLASPRKAESFSAPRRPAGKNYRWGNNGQLVISFTRRVHWPFVPRADHRKGGRDKISRVSCGWISVDEDDWKRIFESWVVCCNLVYYDFLGMWENGWP